MSRMPIIDVHMHVYPTKEAGIADKEAYELWEYGEKPPELIYSEAAGVVEDVLAALDAADASRGIVLNVFSSAGLLESGETDLDEIAKQYKESNQWFCDLLGKHDKLVPFISADPIMQALGDPRVYLQDLVENYGARGLKIHPNLQAVYLHDPRLLPVWKACVELELPVLTHSGANKDGDQYSEPNAFAEVLTLVPDLKLIVAHLGGASWQQTKELAEKFPNIAFDLTEHIMWTKAENAANDRQLAQLILDVGPERVMMGSDFPWYGVDQHVERVMELPLLATEQKEGILGSNALAFLKV